MRVWIVAGMMALATAAGAQDGAHVVTLAKVREYKSAWIGEFVRVENVTISHFSQSKGGLASDGSGSARFDDIGMTMQTIGRLERYCGGARAEPPRLECRGALEFTMMNTNDGHGGFIISEVNFLPEG